MNLLDFILIGIFAYCLIRGFFRGLVGELTSIIGVVGGFYGAYTYYPHLARLLSRWINPPVYQNIVSFLVLFLGICLAIVAVGAVIKYIMNVSLLGWANRTGGAVFGTVKSLVIATILVMMLTAFLPSNPPFLRASLIARHLMQFSAAISVVTTKEMKNTFSAKMKELNQTWKHRKI